MKALEKKRFAIERRRRRIRKKVHGTQERPRLLVHTSLENIYAQVIDDLSGNVLAAASSLSSDLRKSLKSGGNVEAAKAVGKLVAATAQAKGISKVCFDRGGRKYHGRVKALAESAREAGLKF